jgi:hypothetical protein
MNSRKRVAWEKHRKKAKKLKLRKKLAGASAPHAAPKSRSAS